jgi:demethylmenaquinone methyltransferase/2-methoxy-6-polyprenyl-1,4-benzoquinol methylase
MVEKEKNQVADMFNRIAGIYDPGNHLLSLGLDFGWRDRLAAELKKYSPVTVLDLACGTGDLALAIKKQIPGAIITGIDLAPAMLEIFERKLKRLDLGGSISVSPADIELMPFPDQSFDAASVAFGVRNLEDRAKGLKEILRVLKPGGVFAALEFSLPEKGFFAALYRFYLGSILPLIGRAIGGRNAYFYLRDTIREFPAPAQFCAELTTTGFALKTALPLSGGAVWLYLAERPKNPG